jgi:hypothetical protein
MIISIYILLSSAMATASFAIGVAQRRERRRLVTMAAGATIPHRFEQPLSEIAALRMELELRTLQLEAERIETDRLRAIVRETLR